MIKVCRLERNFGDSCSLANWYIKWGWRLWWEADSIKFLCGYKFPFQPLLLLSLQRNSVCVQSMSNTYHGHILNSPPSQRLAKKIWKQSLYHKYRQANGQLFAMDKICTDYMFLSFISIQMMWNIYKILNLLNVYNFNKFNKIIYIEYIVDVYVLLNFLLLLLCKWLFLPYDCIGLHSIVDQQKAFNVSYPLMQ